MRSLIPLLLALLVGPVLAEREAMAWDDSYRPSSFESDFDDTAKAWREIQAQLPPYPKAASLVEFSVGPATRNRFFIDYDSISVGEDGVVRYSVLIRSPMGAETVSFEGMRCENGERKLYAFGHADAQGGGSWSRNRHARWEPIPARQASSHQRELFFHYLCTVDTAGDLKKIRRAVKSGGVRRGD
ncbi:MAG TPA: CNP1-like family protein [Thiobacillaceae bacterium]|nr:CNP1-like family protein [Thiobacillaceae bacterium]HNU64358.1 CNP1-like family protein [Thiobacillaceae bacterium]